MEQTEGPGRTGDRINRLDAEESAERSLCACRKGKEKRRKRKRKELSKAIRKNLGQENKKYKVITIFPFYFFLSSNRKKELFSQLLFQTQLLLFSSLVGLLLMSSPVMLKPCAPSEAHIHDHDQDDAAATQNKDLIGELPDELLSMVASKLYLRDAVKTTVLSKRWTHILSSINEFDFDRFNMFPFQEMYGEDDYPCGEPWSDKFVRGVTRFLDFYQPLHIQSVDFSFCLSGEQADVIDGWLGYVLRKGAQNLRLRLYCCTLCRRDDSHAGDEEGTYVFRSALLNAAKTSLQELHLIRCRMELGPNFSDHYYCQLRVVFLRFVSFEKHELQTMLSCLTKLEYLTLHDCKVPQELSFTSSTLLKELDLENLSTLRKIEMPKSNLYTFRCVIKALVRFDSRGLLEDLENLHYYVGVAGWHNVLASLPQFLPKLERVHISIAGIIDWVEHLSGNVTTFATVTTLELEFLNYTEFCFSVLKAFPCLQELILRPNCGWEGEHLIGKSGAYENKCLKQVEMSCCHPARHAEFVISFLEHASTVEQLMIRPSCDRCERYSWDEGDEEAVLKSLHGVPKNVSVVLIKDNM